MNFADFTNLFPVSKTLRFELIPQGKTLENINKSDIIDEDEHRDNSFSKAKKIIDEYHKCFIERVLCNLKLPFEDNGEMNSITELYSLYRSKSTTDKTSKKNYKDTQTQLRRIIGKAFESDPAYRSMDKEELISKYTIDFINSAGGANLCGMTKDEALNIIKEFDKTEYRQLLDESGVVLSYICPLMYMNNPACASMPVITSSNKLRTYTSAKFYTEDEILDQICKEAK